MNSSILIDLIVYEKFIGDDLLLETLRHLEAHKDAIASEDIFKLVYVLPLQYREPFLHALLEKARRKELQDTSLLRLVVSLLNVVNEKGVPVRNPPVNIILEQLDANLKATKTVRKRCC